MVSGPAHYRLQYHALVGEGTIGIVAHGIAEQVGVTRAVAKVVFALVLVHPAGLEETMGIVRRQRLSFLVHNQQGLGRLGELQHVGSHQGHPGRQRGLLASGQVLVLEHLVVLIPLQLAAPDTTKVGVNLAVIVLEDAGVNGVGTTDRVGQRLEWAFGSIGYSHAQAHATIIVLAAEHQVILAVQLHDIAVPQLFLTPGNVFHAKYLAMVGYLAVHYVIERQHVVVFHLEMSAVIVETLTAIPVVGRIDVETVTKYMS